MAIVYEEIKILPGEGKAFVKVKNADLSKAILLNTLNIYLLILNQIFIQKQL
jgi:hypothetical protein